jgi:hypothetical protein
LFCIEKLGKNEVYNLGVNLWYVAVKKIKTQSPQRTTPRTPRKIATFAITFALLGGKK